MYSKEEREKQALRGLYVGQGVVVHKRARGHWPDDRFGVITGVNDSGWATALEVSIGDGSDEHGPYQIDRDDVIDIGSWHRFREWAGRYDSNDYDD